MAYDVQTAVFEGPFDLLLHLVLEDKVDLFALRLADLVDSYVAALAAMAPIPLDQASEFLLIASTLVELKARRLLPKEPDAELDDELGLWEQRDLLLAKLAECRTFKQVAHLLERRMDEAARSAPRFVGPDDRFAEVTPADLLAGVTPERLRDAFLAATAPRPVPKVTLDHVTSIRTTVSEAIVEVAEEVRRAGRLTFRALVAGLGERIEMIVRFLAVLELHKQGLVELDQVGGNFGSIVVAWAADDTEPLEAGEVDVAQRRGGLAAVVAGADRYEG